MKTVAEHLNSLPDGEFKEWVLLNIDNRYANVKCYTVNYALTFGVLCPGKDSWARIEKYIHSY